jgi:methyl-accepting chemotaxis protein
VIRVVRTATADVDRRLNERHAVDLPCRVMVGSQTHGGRVVDLSDSGAYIRGSVTLETGVRGTLQIDGVDFPLPFVVRSSETNSLHLHFALAQAVAARFSGTPSRLAQNRRAA